MRTVSLPATARAAGRPRSKRMLTLAGDDRLVEQIRRGSEAAFEVAFERHAPPILSFCRHMLHSHDEAEDAVQHTFAAAYRALQRDEREIRLKPWLFTIARNRCLSIIRGRREQSVEQEIATVGLSEQVQQRAELRELLDDVRELPDEQRAALLLAEVADLSHREVATVLGCKVARVKALVFRARSGLIERRDARETPCQEVREQLATLHGGALRRSGLRHHLSGCPGCMEYREKVKRQRAMLAAALPVTPSLGLKGSVLGALGFGGGAAGGGGAILGGAGVAATAPIGATVAKVVAVAALAGSGVVAGERALQPGDSASAGPVAAAAAPVSLAERAEAHSQGPGAGAGASPDRSQRASKRSRSSNSSKDRRRKPRGAHGRDASEPKVKAKGRSRGTPGRESAARAPKAKHRAGARSKARFKPQAVPKERHRKPDLSAESGHGTAAAPGQAKALAD